MVRLVVVIAVDVVDWVVVGLTSDYLCVGGWNGCCGCSLLGCGWLLLILCFDSVWLIFWLVGVGLC